MTLGCVLLTVAGLSSCGKRHDPSSAGINNYGLGFAWAHSVETCAIAAMPINARHPNGIPYAPSDWQGENGFRSRHPGGAHFALGDGSVRFFSDSMALGLYHALATIAGGEPVMGDF